MEVLELNLNGIVRFIVRSGFKQFCSCSCAFNVRIRYRWISTRILVNGFNGVETFYFPLIYTYQRSRFVDILCWSWCELDDDICVDLEFRSSLLEVGCFAQFAGSIVGPTILLFSQCFFWKVRPVRILDTILVRGHWFGCSLWRGTPLKLTLEFGFVCPFVVIDPTN
jgi:hypothetical protein